MNTIDLVLPGELRLRVSTPSPLFTQTRVRLLAGAYLPGVEFDENSALAPDASVLFRDSGKTGRKKLVSRGKTHTLTDTWSDSGKATDGKILDLLHLIYGVARKLWLQRGIYSVHAACVGDARGYRLIVGHSGVGKTSLALKLAEKKSFKVFSGNKTLVKLNGQHMQAIAGTRTMTAREEDVAAFSKSGSADNYVSRGAFLLDKKRYAAQEHVNIKSVIISRLNDGAREVTTLGLDGAMHRLYPYFMDAVNADIVLCDGNCVLSGAAPKGSQARLASSLRMILKRVPVYTVSGSMEHCTTVAERV